MSALEVYEKILLAFCFGHLIFTKSFGLRIRERKIRKEISKVRIRTDYIREYLERYPSGQREQTVNLSAIAFEGSNPSLSIFTSVNSSWFMVRGNFTSFISSEFVVRGNKMLWIGWGTTNYEPRTNN